ncbi:MAG: erythromycin biosynthesis sensory transduction protein eryC1 [Frankiales bacterium]|nr:erythromycin biosynthesis sensory transduction protein eryC1 [Frankiales bacterium]
MTENIPLVDLGLQHRRVADEVREGFDRVLANTSFILGPEAETFERAYAEYCGVAHCVGVGNGTDAIELALRACDIGPGDEVIAPANTFVATAGAIARTGATLKLVDCDENFLIDANQIGAAITARTKAIVPVHLYGQLAPVAAVRAAAPDTVIIEDAAQSQGAKQGGARSGSLGLVAATSFYPGKNLGAYGDAGGVTTSDDHIHERLLRLRNHGGIRKYEHLEVGVNSRLDGLQGVVLAAKLKVLDDWNAERRAAAANYAELIGANDDVRLPQEVPGNEHVWHLYVVRVPRRDAVLSSLNAAGIGAGIHYPAPVHQLPAFAHLGYGAGSFPISESLAGEILSLPIFPGITNAQQERVVHELVTALKG